MTNRLIILIQIVILSGCLNQYKNYRTTLLPIDSTELKFKKGDCISFKIDSNKYGAAIVIDYAKDDGGLWYGICFTDYFDSVHPDLKHIKNHRLVGRKIATSLNQIGYTIGLDIEFVNDSCFMQHDDRFKNIGRVNLKPDKIKFGAEGATNDFDDMISSFQNSRERRKSPPDNYKDHLKKFDKFRPDEYFDIQEFISD